MTRQKIRIRFRKAGDLRLVSHHDLIRCFERMLRRAGLPFRTTQGFNPKPRIVFALSLALGVVGCQEVVEIELDGDIDPAETAGRLAEQAPPGLQILSVRPIDPRLTGRVRRVCYRVVLPEPPPEDLDDRIRDLLSATVLEVRRTRPRPRRLDLRPWIHAIRVAGQTLEIDLKVTPSGGARPEEILDLVGLVGVLERGALVERALVEIEDECPLGDPEAAGDAPAGIVLTSGR